MLIQKALLSLFTKSGFLSNKKLIALFIFASLSVNGFAHSAAEINKYSFVMVAFKVAQNAVVQIFEKCNLSLDSMANEFYADIFDVLESTPLGHSSKKNDDQKNTPVHNGNASINVSQIIFSEKIKILKDGNHFFALHNGAFFEKERFFYGSASGFASAGIILLFLMFIAGILRRKDIDGNTIRNIKTTKKEFSV